MFTKHLFNLFGLFLCLKALSGSIIATSLSRHGHDDMHDYNIERKERFFEKVNRIEEEHPKIRVIAVVAGIIVANRIVEFMIKKNIILGNFISRFAILVLLAPVCAVLWYYTVIFIYVWLEPEQEVDWYQNSFSRKETFSEKMSRITNDHPSIIGVSFFSGVAVTTLIDMYIAKKGIISRDSIWGLAIEVASMVVCPLLFYYVVILLYTWLEPEQEVDSYDNSSSFRSGFSMPSGEKVMGLEDVPPAQMGLILDLILLLFILLGAFRGYKNGLFSQLFSSVAILVFLIFGRYLFDNTITMLNHWWPDLDEGSISFLAIMMLFMSLLFVIFVLERILKRVLQLTFLGYFDSLLGAIVGAVQTSFFLATLISLIHLYGVTLSEEYTANMRIYNTIHSFVPRCMALFQEYFPKYLSWLMKK